MARRFVVLIATLPALLAVASAPVTAEPQPVDLELQQARTEAAEAEKEMRRLEHAAAKARTEAAKLAAERQAAAAAIAASEAQISVTDAAVRLAEARVAEQSERLARRQAPLAALVAGLVTMGRRPPLLSSADSGSLDEFVRIRVLLDTTLPIIRQRSAVLSAELEGSRRLQAQAAQARSDLAEKREELARRQQRFAVLEAQATGEAARLGAVAVSATDDYLAGREAEADLESAAEKRRAGLKLAAELGTLPAAPPRPGTSQALKPPLAYRLPVQARVIRGFGSVSEAGIRARGITLAANRGQDVLAPGDGTIAFAGAFRRHDGVVIIDHGRGWMTMMTGVRSDLTKGSRVKLGQPLGRAIGLVTVELSTNGAPVSAALIAGSSHLLSIKGRSG